MTPRQRLRALPLEELDLWLGSDQTQAEGGWNVSAVRPFISVAIPTFRRPAMLERAVLSVAAQTFRDWEIVVSDDEPGEGEAWALLRRLKRQVPNLRAFKNRFGPGQAGNTNNALLRSRGAWIKPLHDDDRLYPGCLETLAALAARFPDVGCIACTFDRVTPAGEQPFRRGRWALLERMPAEQFHRAMYYYEDVGRETPSARLVSRRVIEAGVLFEEPDGIEFLVDVWFNARAAAQGGVLILRQPLLAYHVGHDAVSTRVSATRQIQEAALLRRYLWGLLPPGRRPASPAPAVQMAYALRGLARARRGRVVEALSLLARVRHPQVPALLVRWGLHRLSAGRYSRARRQRLAPASPR
jgi:GT2 family glycosyltransferase